MQVIFYGRIPYMISKLYNYISKKNNIVAPLPRQVFYNEFNKHMHLLEIFEWKLIAGN